MAFSRSSEPFQEPPQHRPRSPLVIGVVVLFLFFVPLVVVTAVDSTPSPAQSSTGPVPPISVPPLSAPPRQGAPHRVPPMPPPGAPWPPPPGAPVPPVCTLLYRAAADGGTVWTALTTSAGTLTVAAGSLRDALPVGVAVARLRLPTALAQDHGLTAVLAGSGGRTFDCVVGAQRAA